MSDNLTTGEHDLFLAVDIQNDFCPGGSLAVPRGDEVVPLINALAPKFDHVVLTQDWHPRGHLSFASSHPGKQPFQTIEVAYGTQVLWPDHCVQETVGAAFRGDLRVPHAELVLRKGYHREINSYSAFYENDRVQRNSPCLLWAQSIGLKGNDDVSVNETTRVAFIIGECMAVSR